MQQEISSSVRANKTKIPPYLIAKIESNREEREKCPHLRLKSRLAPPKLNIILEDVE